MAKVKYTNLKATFVPNIETIEIEGQKIEVASAIRAEEKAPIVSRVVESSIVNGIVRYDLLSPIFFVEVVKAFTNITFTEKQSGDPLKIYDELANSSILGLVLGAIPESSFEELKSYVDTYAKQIEDLVIAGSQGKLAFQEKDQKDVEAMTALLETGIFEKEIEKIFSPES